jgi:hypothetical protein
MTIRIMSFVGLLAALAGCSENPEPPAKAKVNIVYSTPEAVSDAFFAALQRGDFKTAVNCLPPEKVIELAEDYASVAFDRRYYWKLFGRWEKSSPRRDREGRPKDLSPQVERHQKEWPKRRDALLDKYGLAPEDVEHIGKALTQEQATEAKRNLIRATVGRDSGAFVAEYLEAHDKTRPYPRPDGVPKLKEVTINSDTEASGVLVFPYELTDKGEKREDRRPVSFLRGADGSWRLVLPKIVSRHSLDP